jgi:hypothetical protein
MRVLHAALAERELGLADVRALQPAKGDAGGGDLLAVLLQLLALVVRHRGEKGVEVGEAMVAPVKLHALACHVAGALEDEPVGLVRKQHVHRRHASLSSQGDEGAREQALGLFVARQQARAGHRREGRGHHQLRVIRQPMPLVGLCP